MDLSDLRKSISEMSDDELMAEIKNIRQSRRTPKGEVQTTKQAKSASTIPDVSKLDAGTADILLSLLMKKMEGTNGAS